MGRLPTLGSDELIRALRRMGYLPVRQKRSHVELRAPERPPRTIPAHEPLAPGTLRAILRSAGLTVDDLLALLNAG